MPNPNVYFLIPKTKNERKEYRNKLKAEVDRIRKNIRELDNVIKALEDQQQILERELERQNMESID